MNIRIEVIELAKKNQLLVQDLKTARKSKELVLKASREIPPQLMRQVETFSKQTVQEFFKKFEQPDGYFWELFYPDLDTRLQSLKTFD